MCRAVADFRVCKQVNGDGCSKVLHRDGQLQWASEDLGFGVGEWMEVIGSSCVH